MKTLTNLTAANVTDDGKPTTAPMQDVGGRFQRRKRMTANGVFYESSSGAQVFVPDSAIESVEPLFAAPKTT